MMGNAITNLELQNEWLLCLMEGTPKVSIYRV